MPPRAAPLEQVHPDERTRRSKPLDFKPETITEENFPHLHEKHQDVIRSGLRPLHDTENKIHEVRGQSQRIAVAHKALAASNRARKRMDEALGRLMGWSATTTR